MKRELKTVNFNFEYVESSYTEKDAIINGFKRLSGAELRERIVNKTIYGYYPMGYKFVANIYENGKAEGINDVGTQDFGSWIIDEKKSTLHLEWENGWFDTVTHAYDINGSIEFYDVDTRNWRTTFKQFENLTEE